MKGIHGKILIDEKQEEWNRHLKIIRICENRHLFLNRYAKRANQHQLIRQVSYSTASFQKETFCFIQFVIQISHQLNPCDRQDLYQGLLIGCLWWHVSIFYRKKLHWNFGKHFENRIFQRLDCEMVLVKKQLDLPKWAGGLIPLKFKWRVVVHMKKIRGKLSVKIIDWSKLRRNH